MVLQSLAFSNIVWISQSKHIALRFWCHTLAPYSGRWEQAKTLCKQIIIKSGESNIANINLNHIQIHHLNTSCFPYRYLFYTGGMNITSVPFQLLMSMSWCISGGIASDGKNSSRSQAMGLPKVPSYITFQPADSIFSTHTSEKELTLFPTLLCCTSHLWHSESRPGANW